MQHPTAWTLVLVFSALLSNAAQAGIGRHHLSQGPFGLPSLQVLEEKLQLTHEQKEKILHLYNEYRHRSHSRHHLARLTDKDGSHGSLKRELIAKILAILNPSQRTQFEELIKHHAHKKPVGSS